jgi:hypothetical protein
MCERASGSLVELANGSLPARIRSRGVAQRPPRSVKWGWGNPAVLKKCILVRDIELDLNIYWRQSYLNRCSASGENGWHVFLLVNCVLL